MGQISSLLKTAIMLKFINRSTLDKLHSRILLLFLLLFFITHKAAHIYVENEARRGTLCTRLGWAKWPWVRWDVITPVRSAQLSRWTHAYSMPVGLLSPLWHFVTSAKEVVFSSAFLFVRRIMQYYLTDFHKIRWKGGSWTTRETTRFGGGG